VFSFGADAQAAAFAAPSVEGSQLMEALLTLGQSAANDGQAIPEVGGIRLTLDLPAMQEAFADVVDSHAVDAIVDHFAGDLGQSEFGSPSNFDASMLHVGIGDTHTFYGMPALDSITADDMSALAASA
jgi:hypothetical protein